MNNYRKHVDWVFQKRPEGAQELHDQAVRDICTKLNCSIEEACTILNNATQSLAQSQATMPLLLEDAKSDTEGLDSRALEPTRSMIADNVRSAKPYRALLIVDDVGSAKSYGKLQMQMQNGQNTGVGFLFREHRMFGEKAPEEELAELGERLWNNDDWYNLAQERMKSPFIEKPWVLKAALDKADAKRRALYPATKKQRTSKAKASTAE